LEQYTDTLATPCHATQELYRYENGTVAPPLDRLPDLARTYGTTLAAQLAEHDAAMPVIAAID
jgi:hypothetical protein